jgi:hypothetical protein
VRLQLPAYAPGEVEGLRLQRTPAGGVEEVIELGLLTPNPSSVASKVVAFLAARDYRVTATAYGPGGESARSNELLIRATTSGPCPRPEAPRLIEVVLEIGGERVVVPAPVTE